MPAHATVVGPQALANRLREIAKSMQTRYLPQIVPIPAII